MDNKRISVFELIPTLQNRDEFFSRIISGENPGKTLFMLYMLLMAFGFFYGVVMGSYHGVQQAIAAGVKVAALYTLALVICFPAFFIIQFILGSKLKLGQMTAIILSGFVLTSAIMLSFIPIIVFFLLTGGNYYFLQLLHVAVFGLSGIFGMKTVVDALKYSCEEKSVYPQTGVTVFKFWVVILAFVGMQLAWNLRPFLGDRGEPFRLFREYEGNFYTAVIYSVRQLIDPDGSDNENDKRPVRTRSDNRPMLLFPQDTVKKDGRRED